MHRKHLRATVGTGDVDIPTGTFIADRFLYYNGLAIITVAALRGPVSSTDNAVTRWDGTTGTLVQNSAVIIDDGGNVTGVTTLNTRDPARWVDGPASGGSTDNAIARWDGATGRLIQNSTVIVDDAGNMTVTSINGVPGNDYVSNVSELGASGNVPKFTSFNDITDSGLEADSILFNTNRPVFDGRIVVFNGTSGTSTAASVYAPEDFLFRAGASTDNAVVRWNGTDGDSVQNSVVIIGDTGNASGFLNISTNTINSRDPNKWVDGPTPAAATNNHIALWDTGSGRLIKDSPASINPTTGDISTPGDITPTKVTGIPVGLLVKSSSGTPHPDNSVARWDAAAGNPIQDSTVFIDDAGAITGVTTINGSDANKLITWPNTVGTATPGSLLAFAGASGKSVQDTGIYYGYLVLGPASGVSTNNTFAVWDGTSGRLLKDGGANAVTVNPGTGEITTPVGVLVHSTAGTNTDNAIIRRDGTGYHVQDSTVILSDTGAMSGVLTIQGTTGTAKGCNLLPTVSSATLNRLVSFTGATAGSYGIGDSGIIATSVVTGPASAVDGNIAVFNGTGGKDVRDSGIKASDLFFFRSWGLRSGFAGTSGYDLYPAATAINLPSTTGVVSIVAWVPYQASVGSNIIITISWSGLNLGSGGGQQIGVSTGLVGTGITTSGGSATLSTAAGSAPASGIVHIASTFSATSTTPSLTLNIKSSSGTHTIGAGVIMISQGTQA